MATNLFEVFWCSLLENPTEQKNILLLLQIMMTISISTATCEKVFSKLNIEKTSLHMRISSSMMSCISVLVQLPWKSLIQTLF